MNQPEDITSLKILQDVGRAHGIEAPKFFEDLHRDINALGRIRARAFAEAETNHLRALLDDANGKLHLLQSMMAEAGFPLRIKLGEDLHGNEDWVRVRPEAQLKDLLAELRTHRGAVVG